MVSLYFFFFNDTATTEIYTLSLHDALPIWPQILPWSLWHCFREISIRVESSTASTKPSPRRFTEMRKVRTFSDRKSTRLNSSHSQISYAVFCLKKKRQKQKTESNIVTRVYT